MGHAVYRLGMVRDVQGVKLAHDAKLGAGLAGVDIGIEAGYIAGQGQRIAQGLKLLDQIVVGFPLGIACLGMGPKPSLGVEDHLLMGVYVLNKLLLPVCHICFLLSKGHKYPLLQYLYLRLYYIIKSECYKAEKRKKQKIVLFLYNISQNTQEFNSKNSC